MSETEDIRGVVESNDFHSIIEAESGRSSSVDYLDTYEDVSKEPKNLVEESNGDRFKQDKVSFVETVKKPFETERKEITQPARSTPETTTSPSATVIDANDAVEEEPVAKLGATDSADGQPTETAAVGEWNSLPVLVERLRTALEHSLGERRDGDVDADADPEEPAQPVPEDSGVDSEEDFRLRSSMERVLDDCKEPELRKDLKFLEDLLLSDIETALSRLRETLERIDVAALAKNGAASDPTSKLHLLGLVSSLLSRLQVPEEKEKPPEKPPTPAVLPSTSLSRRRRGTRHTIGVSAEELAKARKWLEEERSNCLQLEDVAPVKEKEASGESTVSPEKKPEEVRDKCIKDAINQRQVLEDKNKEIRESYKAAQPEVEPQPSESMLQYNSYQTNSENIVQSNEESDEKSRVSRLAAALRQRAELASSRYPPANKFTAKKSKIKRANTIDIPSYLKLQAESLGRESTGCISLRRPINVGDKASLNGGSIVPTLQPRTENDRKFLALINKNNEAPVNTAVPYKPFGFAKTTDMSSLANKNWNSRFSNIKTAFDKPAGQEERENRPSLKDRANKMFPGAAQHQVYASDSEPRSSYNAPMIKDNGSGFRHAPSSPFRKIEKSPVSPSKVPPSYHWPKSAPVPTNTLREKARMMFDTAPAKSKPEVDHEKPSLPRPPWLDQDRSQNKNGPVTENGKIDYKSFCKQFAPFVGKSTVDTRKFENQRIPGVVDGKISFKIPDRQNPPRIHQHPVDRREIKDKFPPKNTFETIKPAGYSERQLPKPNFADATLKGSSSVAVQTGINDDHQDEGRSFRVGPRIAKGSTVCSNAAVQTSDLEKPSVPMTSDADTGKQWKPVADREPNPVYRPDSQRFVLDHNQNYRTLSDDSPVSNPRLAVSEQTFRDVVYHESNQSRRKQNENPVDPVKKDPRFDLEGYQKDDREDPPYSFVSPSLSDYNQPEETTEKTTEWPVDDSSFLDDQNIQNQDISSDVGVVTRYTCAIATVASSVDSPEPRSEELLIDSRASSSPSPSQWSSRSRPATSETATPEDEIRRHNLLQQSLVRRLQNEITSLNDEPALYPSGLSQQMVANQPKIQSSSQSESYESQLAQSYQRTSNQPSGSSQAGSFSQSFLQVHRQGLIQPTNSNPPLVPQSQPHTYNQPSNFDQPADSQPSKYGKYLTPVPQKKPEPQRSHSPSPVSANRVGALREAYELPPSSQTKPIQKERSPVPNGAAIDSSDEYLVSCATKPSRSIVLSKSESWHQLAVSSGYPRAPRVNTPAAAAVSKPSPHLKPPKPRSPSSQKLRSKQFEASSMADSVKKMEDKIRQYFDSPADPVEARDHSRNRRSPRNLQKTMVGLSRSRTMPGIADERLRLVIKTDQQAPLLNVNTADVDKVFDDLFEEATRSDVRHRC
ncbi:uncharacterized protein LOC143207556 [Lasioglossum baleicum]|uniref:uncharacterized protein LOC143207556 n=1 Tax=Lasioglossum baleicum TaxID=434251 RepID=UPI003FCE4FF8